MITEMNGVVKAGHIRDKLTRLVTYAETVRALTEMPPALRAGSEPGNRVPRPDDDQHGQVHLRHRLLRSRRVVQDCAGGLLVTGPSGDDWDTPRCEPCSRSTLALPPAEARLRVMNLISDLTARDFGGYHAVLAVHAEGSIEAEKMQIFRA